MDKVVYDANINFVNLAISRSKTHEELDLAREIFFDFREKYSLEFREKRCWSDSLELDRKLSDKRKIITANETQLTK